MNKSYFSIIAFLFFLSLIIDSRITFSQELSTYEEGFDRNGDDWKSVKVDDAYECQDLCEDEKKCGAYTFVNPATDDEDGTCYLKKGVPPKTPNDCCISGVKITLESNTDRPGNDINRREGITDALECQQLCADFQECSSYTYVLETNTCYLKNGFPNAVPNDCCISGIKPPKGLTSKEVKKIKACSNEAEYNVNQAVLFLKKYKSQIKNDFNYGVTKGRERRIKRRIDRKLGKIKVSCAERILCRSSQNKRIAMHAFGIAGNRIRLCYESAFEGEEGENFCYLTGTVGHEFGHMIGIPKKRFGQHSKDQNDRVYKFGQFIEKLCIDEGYQRGLNQIPAPNPVTN